MCSLQGQWEAPVENCAEVGVFNYDKTSVTFTRGEAIAPLTPTLEGSAVFSVADCWRGVWA